MKKSIVLVLLMASFNVFSKDPDPLCMGVVDEAFTVGDGSAENPYLVCNQNQLTAMAVTPALLVNHFKLGSDLDFKNKGYTIIGSKTTPFQGDFNGNGYTFQNLTLSFPWQSYVAPFGFVLNGSVENLTVKDLVFTGMAQFSVGGVVAHAENATLDHLTVDNVNMLAPDYSGGVVGELINSTLTYSSCRGQMSNHFGTDGSGGLVGYARNATIAFSSSNVKIDTLATDPWGVSSIGGLVGYAFNTHLSNVYAVGAIDYSFAQNTEDPIPQDIGGIVGHMFSGSLNFAYYAGKINIIAKRVGGAVGVAISPPENAIPITTVFWDIELSGISESALGLPQSTETLKTVDFWTANAFDPSIWLLVEGEYPTLLPQP